MSSIIDTIYCKEQLCTWELHTDGKAYADLQEATVAYRWPDAQWRTGFVTLHSKVVPVSAKLEELFSSYIGKICTDLIDPHRHLRRR